VSLNIEYKPERHPGRWIALIIFILILGAAGWFGYKWYTSGELPIALPVASANSGINEADIAYDDVKNYSVPESNPRYISIPRLDAGKTRVYSVGLDSNNLIEAATNIHDVTWYNKSGTPGSGGVILMNGHNQGINKNGAFYGLSKLVAGDKITLERGDGQTFSYTVATTETMTLDDVNASGMARMGKSAEPGKEGLNLITFDGKWIPSLGTFDKRTIVWSLIDETK
jgi:sortase (surface protein transpeptidase)